MAITLNQHRAGITQTVIARFTDANKPKSGLSAFFPRVAVDTKQISIEVERNRRLVAVDVQRCTDPNRNAFNKSTEKIFVPPLFSEMFDFTACQRYDETFGRGVGPSRVDAGMLIASATDYLTVLENKIERAILKQQAEVSQTGIVTLKNGDSIDYKRKALSMPVLSGANKWNAPTTAKPLTDLATGANFLRAQGLSAGGTVNAVMGTAAFTNFMSTDQVKGQAEWKNISRLELGMPQFDEVTGLVFQGRIAAGDYIFNLWTYVDSYEADNGTDTPYIASDNVVLYPSDFVGKTVFGAVPMVMGDEISGKFIAPTKGFYHFHDVIDQIKRSWNFILESAPLVVPVSVDRMYTIAT
jgi:hypothetical protein